MGQTQSTQELQDIFTSFSERYQSREPGKANKQQNPLVNPSDGDGESQPTIVNSMIDISTTLWSYFVYLITFPFGEPEASKKVPITHVNWNILAVGLAADGFVTPDVLPATSEFENSVLTLTDSKKTINGYEKMENSKELMEKWGENNPEFDEYQRKLDELLVWETDSFSDQNWKDFYKCETLDEMEEFITAVGYPGRGPVMVKRLDIINGDIITLQEMDKYQYFLDQLENYSSSVGNSQYQRLGFSSVGKSRGKEVMVSNIEDYENYEKSKHHAFIPKLNSNAYSFNGERTPCVYEHGQNNAKIVQPTTAAAPASTAPIPELPTLTVSANEPDNDGSCIFWKSERFDCLEIDYQKLAPEYVCKKGIYQASGIVYAQLLEHGENGSSDAVHVFSTHLTSGNKPEEEAKRVQEIQIVIDFIRSKTTDGYVILGMDGNSYQGFANGDYDSSSNMYSFLQKSGYKTYEPVVADDAECITWSVNKIRGPKSDQIKKIGDYQLDRIDYSVTSNNLTQVENEHQQRLEETSRSARYSTGLGSKEKKEIYGKMLPNMFIPSDHLPVVASYVLN